MFAVIGFLVAGLVVGALARLLRPGRQQLSLPATLALGVAGSLVGGVVATLLGAGSLTELDALGFTVAVVSALLLIGVAEGRAGSRED